MYSIIQKIYEKNNKILKEAEKKSKFSFFIILLVNTGKYYSYPQFYYFCYFLSTVYICI